MKLVLVVDPPRVQDLLLPSERAALRQLGVTMSMVRSSYEGVLRSLLRSVFPDDAFTVEVRRHATGAPLVYGRKPGGHSRVTFDHTRGKVPLILEMAEVAWASTLSQITVMVAVARARGRG